MLPLLRASKGQVVFVNSTAGLRAGSDNCLYAALAHALHSAANGIRDQVHQYGIRVVSVFPGRTATRMQEAVHHFEGRNYVAADLMQASDVAGLIVDALTMSQTAEVTDVVMRPMKKPACAA